LIFAQRCALAFWKFSSHSCLSICLTTLERWSAFASSGFHSGRQDSRVGRELVADAIGTIFGSLVGTSNVTSYIESVAGVAGARTGLSNVFVAMFFLLAMFCSPLAAAIPGYATAPALVLVGALMTQSIAQMRT
jgi:xanthine/uracil/vitamin C permease (AzgA family)